MAGQKTEFTVERSIRLHPIDHAELETFSRSLGLPQAVLIRWAIREWLDRQCDRPSIIHDVKLVDTAVDVA